MLISDDGVHYFDDPKYDFESHEKELGINYDLSFTAISSGSIGS